MPGNVVQGGTHTAAVPHELEALPVAAIQRALAALSAASPAEVPSPGAIDGIWGPRTQASLEAWFGTEFPPSVEFQIDVWRRGTRAPDQDWISVEVLAGSPASPPLASLASQGLGMTIGQAQRLAVPAAPRQQSTAVTPAPSPAPVMLVNNRRSGWFWVLGALGAAAVGGLAWWWFKRKRRG